MAENKIKQVHIELPRQDYRLIELSITENGENVKLSENDKIFMTAKAKKDDLDDEAIFKKWLGNGITYNESTKKYEIEIRSEDTINTYATQTLLFDIVVVCDGKVKQKAIGDITIGNKYTLEVS